MKNDNLSAKDVPEKRRKQLDPEKQETSLLEEITSWKSLENPENKLLDEMIRNYHTFRTATQEEIKDFSKQYVEELIAIGQQNKLQNIINYTDHFNKNFSFQFCENQILFNNPVSEKNTLESYNSEIQEFLFYIKHKKLSLYFIRLVIKKLI